MIGGGRSGFGGLGQLPHVSRGSGVGVLEDTSLIRNVEHVFVRGPRLSSGLADWDLLLSGILKQGLATSESVVKL